MLNTEFYFTSADVFSRMLIINSTSYKSVQIIKCKYFFVVTTYFMVLANNVASFIANRENFCLKLEI